MSSIATKAGNAPSKDYGQQRFDEVYQRALERKRLFKEYIHRNQVMEKLNQAIEALYESEHLPEDPLDFIAKYVKDPKAKSPTLSAVKVAMSSNK